MKTEKTHWLQSPNKNYLGHWDLPENKDLTLTIASAQWEEVKNPVINKSEAKRVVRFKEDDIKPWICNQGNAQSILKATSVKYMEDSPDQKIILFTGVHFDRVSKSNVDCIRVRDFAPKSQAELPQITDFEKAVEYLKGGKTIEDLKKLRSIDQEMEDNLKAEL